MVELIYGVRGGLCSYVLVEFIYAELSHGELEVNICRGYFYLYGCIDKLIMYIYIVQLINSLVVLF